MRMPDKWHGIILGNDEGAEADGRREWQREVGGGGLAASEEPRDGGNARAMPYGSKHPPHDGEFVGAERERQF